MVEDTIESIGTRSRAIDIHVVANRLSTNTASQLERLGFDRKLVVGGDRRVRMQYLYSILHRTLRESDEVFAHVTTLCQQDEEFFGYAEQEIVTHDQKFHHQAASTTPTNLDIEFEVSPCPESTIKGCDIHFAIPNTSESVVDSFERAGFYNLVLNKRGLGDVAIYTMQFELVEHGKLVWDAVTKFLAGSPDLTCDAKFEITRNLVKSASFVLPPLVLRYSKPNHQNLTGANVTRRDVALTAS